MKGGLIKNPTQKQRILELLQTAQGNWVDGMTFLNLDRPITQYHARIFELQQEGYDIEGRFVDGRTWKEYRLKTRENQTFQPISDKYDRYYFDSEHYSDKQWCVVDIGTALICDCPAFQYKRTCKHTKEIKDKLKKQAELLRHEKQLRLI